MKTRLFLFFVLWASILQAQVTFNPEISKNIPITIITNGERHTSFVPETHGFNFENSFKNKVTHVIVTGGRCYGMIYSALDYFNKSKPVPRQDYRPADNTQLSKYIYGRQIGAMTNLDVINKFSELGFNPGGARTTEFFNWGLQGFNGGRLEELRKSIDAGKPVPLGLYNYGSMSYDGAHHAVLAIGYKMGNYKGDLKENKEDLRIYIYDPNVPNSIRVMKPLPDRNYYVFEDEDWVETDSDPDNDDLRAKWMTYFVDNSYNSSNPPNVAQPPVYPNDNKVHEIQLLITTGNDDLRGGSDNLDIQVKTYGGSVQTVKNANASERWVGGSLNYVNFKITNPMLPHQINPVTLKTFFKGGVDGDNWDIENVVVKYRINNVLQDAIVKSCKTSTCKDGNVVRFTGDKHEYKMYSKLKDPEEYVNTIGITFKSNYDLLVKGNRMQARVNYKDGSNDVFDLTDGRQWDRKTIIPGTFTLNRKKKGDIRSITLIHYYGDGLLKLARFRLSKVNINYTTTGGVSSKNMVRKRSNVIHDFKHNDNQLELRL